MNSVLRKRLEKGSISLVRSCQPSFRFSTSGNPSKWAVGKRWIAQGESPLSMDRPIRYNLEHAPWSKECMEMSVDPSTKLSVLWFGSNLAKTAIMANIVGYTVDEAPGNILMAYKTVEQCERFSKSTLAPMIEATPQLRMRIAPPKSRESSNTTLYKKFPGGFIALIGTESVAGFRMYRAKVVCGDEIDSWTGDVEGEGDPVALLLRRADGFSRSIKVLGSTPKTKGSSRIENWYNKSDMRKWFVPCRRCGAMQVIMWANIKWPKGKHELARWHCAECDADHDDQQRRQAVRDGEWRPTAPFNGIRGYWLPGMNSLMPANQGYSSRLHQFAADAHDAAHSDNPEAKKTWVQTFLNESWQDEVDAAPEWQKLMNRREDYDHLSVSSQARVLVAGVDVQADRIECEVVAFGEGEESWGVRHMVFEGEPRQAAIWGNLEAALELPVTRVDGVKMKVRAVGIDTGYPAAQRMAYEFIRARQSKNWFALKGSSLPDAFEVSRAAKSKVERVRLLSVGTNRIKGVIYDRAAYEPSQDARAGFMHFPSSYRDEWFEQLLSEVSSPLFKNGVRLRIFKLPPGRRNEALDMRVYAIAALRALGPQNWTAIEAMLQEEKAAEKQVPDEKPVVSHSYGEGGFVGGRGFRI